MKDNFLKNKYSKFYFDIITKAQLDNRQKGSGIYYELHHILPSCLFPKFKNLSQNKWNGVLLTFREHFICHWLLTKMVENRISQAKLSSAFGKLSSISNTQERKLTSKQYEILKGHSSIWAKLTLVEKYGEEKAIIIKNKMSETRRGKKQPQSFIDKIRAFMINFNHSENTKSLISKKAKERFKDKEYYDKWFELNKNRNLEHTEEAKLKFSEDRRGDKNSRFIKIETPENIIRFPNIKSKFTYEIEGMTFYNMKECSENLKLSKQTIKNRCNSPNFEKWKQIK